MIIRILVTGALIATVPVLTSCKKPSAPAQAHVEALRVTPYPSNAPFKADLDIVATREGGSLLLVNRTARRYENVQIWLNQQHIGLAPQILIGDSNRYELSRFINEHGEPYPIGGFLTPEKTFPIVVAEMFDPSDGARYRLLVR